MGSCVAWCFWSLSATMHLMYHLDEAGNRVYTLKKADPETNPTLSAHPARFSPDDKFSRPCAAEEAFQPVAHPARSSHVLSDEGHHATSCGIDWTDLDSGRMNLRVQRALSACVHPSANP